MDTKLSAWEETGRERRRGTPSCCMIHLSLRCTLFKAPTAVFISAHYQNLQSPSPPAHLSSSLLYELRSQPSVKQLAANSHRTCWWRSFHVQPLTGRLYHIHPSFPINWSTFSKALKGWGQAPGNLISPYCNEICSVLQRNTDIPKWNKFSSLQWHPGNIFLAFLNWIPS